VEGELDSIAKETDSFRYSNFIQAVTEDLKAQRTGLVAKPGTLGEYWSDGLGT
jgi:hypothetical protein